MRDKTDHSGEVHGRLTLLSKNENRQEYWCSCSCGRYTKDNPKLVRYQRMVNGSIKSCGCYNRERSSRMISEYNKSLIRGNTYDLSGEYGIGYTSNGEEFYFDLEDYDKIKDYTRFINSGYVRTKRDGRVIKLHKLLCEGEEIDHFNRNKLDNRKSNLRPITHKQNMLNRSIAVNNTSGVTGVSFNKSHNKWYANISENGNRHSLGYFDNFDDAVAARKAAEEKYFGGYNYNNNVKGVV